MKTLLSTLPSHTSEVSHRGLSAKQKDILGTAFLYLAAFLFCILLSVPACSRSLNLDESYTVVLVRKNLPDMIRSIAKDVHPPFYYLFLWIYRVVFGESIIAYRWITLSAAFLNLLFLGATLIRKTWGKTTAFFYILLFGSSYCTLEKSLTIRMYPLGCFLVTAVFIFLFRLYHHWSKRDYTAAILFTIAAMYTHYFAVMAVFAAWVFFFLFICFQKREKLLSTVCAGILIGLGFLPWMSVVISQTRKVSNHYWITGFDWYKWFISPSALMENNLTGIGTLLQFFLLSLFFIALLKKETDVLTAGIAFAATMCIGAILSITITPIWDERFLYNAWGELSLMAAIFLGKKRSTFSLLPQITAALLLGTVAFFSYSTLYSGYLCMDSTPQWIAFLDENVQGEDLFIVDDAHDHSLVYEAYLPDNQVIRTQNLKELPKEQADSLLQPDSSRRIWYAVNYIMQADGVDSMTAFFEGHHLRMTSCGHFTIQAKEIELFRVEFRIETVER